MISSERISIILPQSAQDVYGIAQDILRVAVAFGNNKTPAEQQEFIDWLATVPHVLTMVYVDEQPAAWIRIDDHDINPEEVGRKCLEFSGAILPEFQGEGLTEAVSPVAIQRAFKRSDAKKVIAITQGDNPAAAAALLALGFKYRTTDTDGRRIYRLMRKDYAEAV
jgi:RimJ/RimL family protein N-acetyltransferase